MMKPKAALVKSGFLPPGSENKRGRMSAAAIAECQRLVAEEGYRIEGFETTVSNKPDTAPTVEKVKVAAHTIVDIPDQTRDESTLSAFADGKSVGMRTVCNGCRASLTYCHCSEPTVWVDYDREAVVYFRERK